MEIFLSQNGYKKAIRLFKNQKFVALDVGCGENASPGWYRMDIRNLPGIHFVHDIEQIPWPFPNSCIDRILMSHIVEHLNPKILVLLFNEIWRVMKPKGELLVATPHAQSHGAAQDPTHIHCWNETTPQYFDPEYGLYNIYKPKPWKIKRLDWDIRANLECVYEKIGEKQAIRN